jgi:type I restriction enzyme M protein
LEEIVEMLTSETKNRINACRDVLVGKLPLPTDQVELITLALIYKFMDDLDEESVNVMKGKRSFFTGDLAKYRWRNLLPQTVSAEERMTLFAEGIEALGHAQKAAHLPGLFRDIFRNAFLKFRDGRILTLFLTEVNGFAYSHSEELGNAFEYLLQCMGTQGENGQFRTPRHIIDFIVDCLEPQPGEKILDPACGTGGFLVSAYKHILARHTSPGSTIPGDLLTHAQRQAVYQNLAGYDITDLMVKLSKVNLFLHGFPDPAIHIYDTLSNDARWHEKADLILANPPFMTPKGGVTPHTKFRIAAKKAEVLFTDYIAEHLTPDGRGGVIVPNGIVATTQNAYVKLRRFLVEDSLVTVVSLPAGVFKPYSGVKTSILLLDKKLARTAKEILFLKITADGFDLGDKRTPIEANDLPEAERVVKLWLAGKLKEGTESAVAWKAVEKKELLAHRSVSLQSEGLFGDKVVEVSDHEEVPLGELCEILDSQRRPITKSDRKPGAIPYYGATGVVDYVEGFLFDEPLVLIGEDGAKWGAGEQSAFAISGKTWVNNHAHVLRPNRSRILDTFLIAILNRLDLMPYVTGVTVPKLNQANLREIPIPLPPLEEQRRIVAEIEGYQKVLDGARQILAGYRVDIEPDTDWPVVPLGDVLNFVCSGVTPKGGKATYLTSGVLFIRSQNVLWGSCDFSDAAYISPETHAEMIRTAVKQWDVFLNITGASIGRSALYTETREANVNQHVAILRPNEKLLPAFLTRCLISSFMQRNITTAQTGASREALNYQQIKDLEIPLPPLAEQRRIVAELDAEAAQMDSVRSLLPRFEAKIQRVLARVWGNGESE